jgi:hypothetical protein
MKFKPLLSNPGNISLQAYTFSVSYLLLARIGFPNLKSNQGIGINTTVIKAKRLVAQPIPSFSYICNVNKGNTAPNVYLKNPFPANALALVVA